MDSTGSNVVIYRQVLHTKKLKQTGNHYVHCWLHNESHNFLKEFYTLVIKMPNNCNQLGFFPLFKIKVSKALSHYHV